MSTLSRRLLPLFIADFFAGMMFWWPILLPFMHKTGITTAQIGLYSIVANIAILSFEVPSGIWADRWSRKNVVIVGLVLMGVGSCLLGVAHNFYGFALGAIFTSGYFAIRSGMQEAMIYDILLEDNRRADYERQVGRLRTTSTVGIVISSLAGAAIASHFGFSWSFYISAGSCLLSIVFLTRFREPKLHKELETSKLLIHIRELVSSLNQHREMRLLVIVSILIGIEFCFMTQLDQLWPIALGLGLAWYGPLNAFLMSSQGVAAPIAARAAKNVNQIKLTGVALFLGSLGLLMHNILIVGLSEFLLLAMATALKIVLSGRIQDQLPSSQRSGAESAVSTFSTLAFIFITILFSAIAESHSVFVAAWIVVLVAALSIIGIVASLKSQTT